MRTIELVNGRGTVSVDDEDFERLSAFRWYAKKDTRATYAFNPDHVPGQYMHRYLLGNPPGVLVDHEDGDGLNNQKYNLREATRAQNRHNQGKHRTNTSGLKGVSWHKSSKLWRAQIYLNGRQYDLGRFDTKEEGGAAYAAACTELHGAFGRTADFKK